MPTIELVSIDCPGVPELPMYPSFDYLAEEDLVTHRGLFQPVFDSFEGCIVHLVNKGPDPEKVEFYFAGWLMDWERGDSLIFRPEVLSDVVDLMRRLMDASPRKRITFSTDYQFGGRKKIQSEVTLSAFLDRHDRGKLRYNHLWFIVPDDE